jgi:hypothetical protein
MRKRRCARRAGDRESVENAQQQISALAIDVYSAP